MSASLVALFFSLVLLALPAMAEQKAPKPLAKVPDQEEVLRTQTYEEISGAANYLMVRIESALGKKKPARILKCDPSLERAQTWLSGPVHALVDGKLALELVAYKKDPSAFAKRIHACHKSCSCSSFSLLLDPADTDLAKNAQHLKNKQFLDKEMSLETPALSLSCAKKFQKFCGSKIYKYLDAGY